jgi:hypothetical protein
MDPATATLWFAGKNMERDQKLEKYSGRNDKTTIKAKLAKVYSSI